MEEPKEESVEEPVHSRQDAEEANAWMTKELATIGGVSIVAVLLLALGMMQATGLVELVPGGGTGWEIVAFGVLVLAVAGWFAWSRRGV